MRRSNINVLQMKLKFVCSYVHLSISPLNGLESLPEITPVRNVTAWGLNSLYLEIAL